MKSRSFKIDANLFDESFDDELIGLKSIGELGVDVVVSVADDSLSRLRVFLYFNNNKIKKKLV